MIPLISPSIIQTPPTIYEYLIQFKKFRTTLLTDLRVIIVDSNGALTAHEGPIRFHAFTKTRLLEAGLLAADPMVKENLSVQWILDLL